MMLVLVSDVRIDGRTLGMTDRENPIPSLPRERRYAAIYGLRPLRRFGFGVLNQLCNGNRPCKTSEKMNMVNVTTHGGTHTVCCFDMVSQHTEHLFAEHCVLKIGASVLCGEDEV